MDRIIQKCCADIFDIAVVLAGGMKTWVRVPADSVEQAKLLAEKEGFTIDTRVMG